LIQGDVNAIIDPTIKKVTIKIYMFLG